MRTLFRHTLLRARDWQERAEFGEVCDWWRKGGIGVCALVAIGGAGKTAIADRFLQVLPGVFPPHPQVVQRTDFQAPSQVLVFSFAEGNVDEFLRDLAWLGSDQAGAKEELSESYQQVLELLRKAAAVAGSRLLLVLDGLENIQDEGRRGAYFGQLIDERLRDLVLRVADGWAPNVSLLVTSRFRLFDPIAQRSLHYLQICIDRLERSAAIELLRARGAKGTDQVLDTIGRKQQYHALSLDLIGGYIGAFCEGDPNRLPAAPELLLQEGDEDPGIAALRYQENRFSEIAEWYRDVLEQRDPAALALLERVCLFRLGVDAATLAAIFTGEGKEAISGKELASVTESEIERKLKQLAVWRLVEGSERAGVTNYLVHTAVRDGLLRQLDQTIVRSGHEAAMKQLEGILSGRSQTDTELTGPALDLTEEIIHHAIEAGQLKAAFDLYYERLGFRRLGYRARAGDLERGRRICEALAGPLVFRDVQPTEQFPHSELTRTLGEWATYCLELGRLDEAVRIRRLHLEKTTARSNAEAYAYLGEVLLLQGRIGEAIESLNKGYHVAHSLGDASAGKKVYGFLGHAHSMSGNSDEATTYFEDSRRLQNLDEYSYPLSRPGEFDSQPLYSLGGVFLGVHYLRCGRWIEAEDNALFNYRRMKQMNPDSAMIPRITLIVAEFDAHNGHFNQAYGLCRHAYEWALARDAQEVLCWSLLTRARIGLRELDSAAERPDRDVVLAAVRASVKEGLHIARQCGFGIYHIDLMLESARLRLLSGDPASVLEDVGIAVDIGIRPLAESGRPVLLAASEPDCGYVWGISEGRHRRGEAMLLEAAQRLGKREVDPAALDQLPVDVSRRIEAARVELEEARSLMQSIQDPRAAQTQQVLEDLARGILSSYPLESFTRLPATRAEASVRATEAYDVFLSHNSADKPEVRLLAAALRARGLSVWMDEAELIPGRPWQDAIEQLIQVVKSAAVLVGPNGLGPWETVEMRACLQEFVRRGLPVIPIALPGAPGGATLPLFLQQFTWVNLRSGMSGDALERLKRAIVG